MSIVLPIVATVEASPWGISSQIYKKTLVSNAAEVSDAGNAGNGALIVENGRGCLLLYRNKKKMESVGWIIMTGFNT